jgi:ParB/RepB/Spo0J family partition protein
MSEQTLLPLPYEPVQAANRATIRENSLRGGRETVYVDVSNIIVREGFNIRVKPDLMSDEDWNKELEIEELAANILENGMEQPLQGVFNTDGKFVLLDGYRRLLAVQLLIGNGLTEQQGGKPMSMVEVIQAPKELTEDQWIVRMLNSNSNLKYQPIQIANGLLRLKKHFGYSNEQIADKLGKSRQYVDDMINLAQEPEGIKNAVAAGVLKPTVAKALRQNVEDPEKREAIVKDIVDKGEELTVKDAKDKKEEQKAPEVDPYVGMRVDDHYSSARGWTGTISRRMPPESNAELDDPYYEIKWDNRNDVSIIPLSHILFSTTTVDDKSSLREEEKSHETSAKAPTAKAPKSQRDALPPVDYTKDKTEAEMNMNEVMKLLDKLEVKAGYLPEHLKQYKDEYCGLINFIKIKVSATIELIKKAPVKAEEDIVF